MRVPFSSRWRLAALITAGGLLAVMIVPADAAVTRSTGPLSLATGSYFGALVDPDRTNPSSTPAEVIALEGKIGRKLDIVNHFYTYNQIVGTQGEVEDVAGGRIPMVTWGATTTSSINNGSQDAYITAQANRLKNLGAPVFLRYYHEPEGTHRANIIGSPAAYISAWKRARSLFAAAGATNVIWVFTTTAYSFRVVPDPPPQAFYPGNDHVDWIAADGYNFAPNKPGAKWNSFQTVFGKWYTWAATMPKPIMVAEYGVMEDPAVPARKSTWYNEMRSTVKTAMPLIQGVVAWSTTNVKEGNTYNWNVDSSAASLAAWKAMGEDPYFRPLNASPPAPACSDGLDNDADGQIDFPVDPGCVDAADTDETNATPPPENAKVVMAAGDIVCDPASLKFGGIDPTVCQHRATHDLLAGADAILPLGDLQYEDGTLDQFIQGYDPSWGQHALNTYPAVGNHEYRVLDAQGYFDYWASKGRPTGGAGGGYYSFDVGSWHLIALNSNCTPVPCGEGSPQNDFLEQDLASTTRACIAAYWHHPLFNSGTGHGSATPSGAKAFWNDLFVAGADIVLNGHEHNYQRYAKQDAAGQPGSNGIREFVVGTGGKSHYGLLEVKDANFEVGIATDFGVLRLYLGDNSYTWEFVGVGGAVLDAGGPVPCN